MLDDELLIETPERVELHYILANIGNRFLAAAIDHIIQLLLAVALVLILGGLTKWDFFSAFGTWVAAIAILAMFAIYWGYFVLFETFWNGQTPGKRIMKLRVVREDGRPIRFFEAFVRNLLRIVDISPPFSYAIGVATIIFSPRSKRIGDLVAGTVVVKERASEAPSLDEIIRLSEVEQKKMASAAPAPFKANTRLLSERELQAVETFLNRRFELNEPNRSMLAARIAQAVSSKLGILNVPLSPEAVLEEVERQHRVQSRYID
jgi:uncharacterized RDD family membrane protein YckC